MTYAPPGGADVASIRAMLGPNLAVLVVLAAAFFAVGAFAVPTTDD